MSASALLVAAALFVCAGGYYALAYRPLSDSLASAELSRAAAGISGDLATIFVRVEAVTRAERAWGAEGLIDVKRVDAINALLQPVLTGTSHILSFAIAQDTGRELLIVSTPEGGWLNRLSDPDAWGSSARYVTHDAAGDVTGDEPRASDYDARKRPWFQAVMPSIVALDVALPDADGFALARWLKTAGYSGRLGR